MSNLELLDRAAASATCQVLGAAGTGLVGAGAVSLWAGGTGFAAMGAGAISLLAANYLCSDMPLGGDPPSDALEGCQAVDGYGTLMVRWGGEINEAFPPGNNSHALARVAVEIIKTEVRPYSGGKYVSYIEWKTTDGQITSSVQYNSYNEELVTNAKWSINPTNGTCVRSAGDYNPVPPEAFQPIEYTDNITNCNYNVTLQGFAQEVPNGGVNPVYLVESAPEVRADGGRMGGCNFPPTIYMPQPGGGGGGGGITIPVPPGGGPPDGPGGIPWWAGPLAGAVAGALLNQLADLVGNALQPVIEESDFTLVAPCDKDAEGNALTRVWSFPQQTEAARLLSHQVALMQIMQQHLDWKTPICRDTPTLEGDFRTISFRSDQTSPYGKSRVRKRFRYRSVSGLGLSEVVDHWKDFTFEAGPVCVIHSGGSWGTPQVWAATADEGKRVIRHAGGEAGFDPDQNGKWTISGSDSARYGVPGTMRVDITGGYYWITARDGSDQRPVVALT